MPPASNSATGQQMTHILIKPLHMYCKTLVYQDDQSDFSITVEDSPTGALIVWELDIPGDAARRAEILRILRDHLASGPRARELMVCEGETRVG
jgi:hypothetical protein